MTGSRASLAPYANLQMGGYSTAAENKSCLETLAHATRELGLMLQTSLHQEYAISLMPSRQYIHLMLIKDTDPQKEPRFPLTAEIYETIDDYNRSIMTMQIRVIPKDADPRTARQETVAYMTFRAQDTPEVFKILQDKILEQLDESERARFESHRNERFSTSPPAPKDFS